MSNHSSSASLSPEAQKLPDPSSPEAFMNDSNEICQPVNPVNANKDNSNNEQKNHMRKSNKNLTPAEKKAKRELKRNIKLYQRIHKLSKRIKHAQSRKDVTIEKQTQKELQKLILEYKSQQQQQLQEEKEEKEPEDQDGAALLFSQPLTFDLPSPMDDNNHEENTEQNSSSSNNSNVLYENCRKRILSLYNQVIQTEIQNSNASLATSKNSDDNIGEKNGTQTRDLLMHMTKGTQSRDMFRNSTALWGYTRQKFYSRASLTVNSLLNLQRVPPSMENDVSPWQRLKNVQSVCSVGCGPGNDVAGLLALFQQFESSLEMKRDDGYSHIKIKEVVLLDYAMEDWKQVLKPILHCCQQEQHLLHTTSRVVMEECNITLPLFPDTATATDNSHHVNVTAAKCAPSCDLFIISYLLSETRGLWDNFVLQLLDVAKIGSMFYFAEPTPWQLQRLISMLDDSPSSPTAINGEESQSTKKSIKMRFIWLDSSMNIRVLQGLQARLGPAVLFGIKLG